MEENQQLIELLNERSGVPVESFGVALRTPKRKRGYRPRASRATKPKRYHEGLVTKAGTLTGWHSSFNPLNRHLIAVFTCSRCKREKCKSRMDAYLDRDQSCGCLSKANRNHLIWTVINSIPENVQEQIGKACEIGQLPSKGGCGTYKANAAQIALHFKVYGKLALYAVSKIRRRWAESEWDRLGQERMEQTWLSVLEEGGHWTARRYFHGMTASVKAACRWVRLYSPLYSATLQTA
jgi:hypothetical protein